MALLWNPAFLNRAVAPGIAEFTTADLPNLDHHGSSASGWLATEVLNGIHNSRLNQQAKQHTILMLHRAQACYSFYQLARQSTLDFLAPGARLNPRTPLYYTAVTQWESCLINLQVFTDTRIKLDKGKRPFAPRDGSHAQRAYSLASLIRHWGMPGLRPEQHDHDALPLWLTNEGLHNNGIKISYRELSRLVEEACLLANTLQAT
jgi:hypothetical protein